MFKIGPDEELLVPLPRAHETPSINRVKSLNQHRLWESFLLGGFLFALAAVFVLCSQAPYEDPDEGFHLLASQLINLGKRPYLDFFYQHVPAYVYVNAAWLAVFGNSWRSAHFLSAILTVICALMISRFFYTRMETYVWKIGCAAIAPVLFLSSALVSHNAPVSQPYGWCLCFGFGAFLLTLKTLRQSKLPAVVPGLFSGLATAGSLLAAPIGPVLFLWVLTQGDEMSRKRKAAQFAIGWTLGLLPVGLLAIIAPEQMFFDVVGYHLTSRFKAPLAPGQDFITTVTSWLGSVQAVLLVVLSLIGIALIFGRPTPRHRLKSEFTLCSLLVLALTIFFCLIRPTFKQYFTLTVPFLIVLACSGFYAIGTLIGSKLHAGLLATAFMAMFLCEGALSVRRQIVHPYMSWTENEQVAALIDQVASKDSPVYTDDAAIYVAAKRVPPPGLENNYSAYLDFNPKLNKLFHIVPAGEIDSEIKSGHFPVAVAWSPLRNDHLHLNSLYKQHRDYERHEVFWGWSGSSPDSQPSGK